MTKQFHLVLECKLHNSPKTQKCSGIRFPLARNQLKNKTFLFSGVKVETELISEDITAAIGGVTTSDTITATIPTTTTAGDYTIRIRVHDATTGQYFYRDLETIAVY